MRRRLSQESLQPRKSEVRLLSFNFAGLMSDDPLREFDGEPEGSRFLFYFDIRILEGGFLSVGVPHIVPALLISVLIS